MQKYQDVVLNQNGNPVSGVQVTVTDLLGTPVSVYSANAIGLNVNPLTSDNNGRFSFYAPDGRYSLSFSFGGNVVASITDILLEDPMDGSDAVFNDVTILGELSDASKVTSAPVGGLTATNVQAALAELDGNKIDASSLAAPGGSALVGFKQSGTGAVDRTIDDELKDSVSVKQFGAVGDGVADDTDAVLTAIIAAQLAVKALRVPAGLYICDERLISSVGKTLVIYGDSADVSEIRWTNAAGGIQFDGGTIGQSRPARFVMRDICLSTTATGGGSAVAVAYQGGVGTTSQLLSMDRVLIRGAGNDAYWTIGCDFDNVRNSQLSNVSVIGSITNQVAMSNAYRIGDSLAANPVDITLENCNAFFCDVAVDVGDNGVGTAEGVSIIGGRYILNNYGVRWNTLLHKPLLHVIGAHIASRTSCIYTRKNIQSMFSENLLYVRDETTTDFTAIDCEADVSVGWDGVIANNVIKCSKGLTPLTDGIYVKALRGVVANNVISDADTGIEFPATSTGLMASSNSIRLAATPYVDAGTSNRIIDFERGDLRVASGITNDAYVTVAGSTSANGPRIYSDGTGANVPLRLSSKGTGLIQFLSGLVEQFRVQPNAAAVNYLRVGGAVTGAPVQIAARGSDANIDLELQTQGTGLVRFGTRTASADAPVTGYIEIKDSAGTVRRLAVIG